VIVRSSNRGRRPPRQRGAALALALLLLLALTALAVFSVRAPHRETRRAAAAINTRLAFESAERGLEAAVAHSAGVPGDAHYRLDFDPGNGVTEVPAGFSIGSGSAFRAYHFDAVATGTAADRSVTLRQGFFVVGPADD
jgi:PilX N-terminal